MKKATLLFSLIGLLSLGGCFSRTIVGVEESATKPVMLITTADNLDLWVYKKLTIQYWECDEGKDQVVCKKACGGDSDLTCPAITGAMGGGATNNFNSAGK